MILYCNLNHPLDLGISVCAPAERLEPLLPPSIFSLSFSTSPQQHALYLLTVPRLPFVSRQSNPRRNTLIHEYINLHPYYILPSTYIVNNTVNNAALNTLCVRLLRGQRHCTVSHRLLSHPNKHPSWPVNNTAMGWR